MSKTKLNKLTQQALMVLTLAMPLAGHAASDNQDVESAAIVLSGWSENITANQLIRQWVARSAQNNIGGAATSSLPSASLIGTVAVSEEAWRQIKNGLGVDYRVAQNGGVHLNVYSRATPRGEGVRLTLNGKQELAQAPTQSWTLGASLQQVRTEDGERFLSVVPQLVVNPDGAHGATQRWRFSMEYGYWFGASERAAVAERVVQARISAYF